MGYLCDGSFHEDIYLCFGMGDRVVRIGLIITVYDGNMQELDGVWKYIENAWQFSVEGWQVKEFSKMV